MGVSHESPAPGLPVSLVAIEWCGVCGAALPQRTSTCPACHSPVAGNAVPSLGARTLGMAAPPASSLLVVGAWLVDVIVALAVAGAAAMCLAALGAPTTPGFVVAAALVGLVVGLALVACGCRARGRSLGGLVCGVRTVDRRFYLPAWPIVAQGPARLRPTMVDIRAGLDPNRPALGPWRGLRTIRRQSGAGEDADVDPRTTTPAGVTVIVFDSGQVHWFTGSCLLGRSPVDPSGADVLPLPDLSRRLSANHAQLVVTQTESAATVWLVDQGSATGTWVERSGSIMAAPARIPVALWPGDQIRLGDFRFHLAVEPGVRG